MPIEIVDPDFSIFSPPCGPLSLLQILTPDGKRSDPVGHQMDVRQAKNMIALSLEKATERIDRGRFFLFERRFPLSSSG